ncbi:DMT family transporter [Parapedomonas caeni]|jgi:drug/metabolite transporter (DMT)-like permease
MARLAFPALLLGSASLSVGPLMVRVAEVGPLQSAFWRLTLGVLPLLLLTLLLPAQRPRRPLGWKAVGAFAVAGAFFAADLIAWHMGIMRTTLANASLFANLTGFIMAGYGLLVLGERLTRRVAFPLLLAAPGVILLFGASAQVSMAHLTGDLMCLLAAFFYTGYLVTVADVRARQPVLTVLTGATIAGMLVLLPVVVLAPEPLLPGTAAGWLPLLMLGLGSQVIGQGLIVYAVAHLTPTASGIGLLLQPVIGVALGWAVYDEVLSVPEMIGAGLLLLALITRALPARPARPAPEAE